MVMQPSLKPFALCAHQPHVFTHNILPLQPTAHYYLIITFLRRISWPQTIIHTHLRPLSSPTWRLPSIIRNGIISIVRAIPQSILRPKLKISTPWVLISQPKSLIRISKLTFQQDSQSNVILMVQSAVLHLSQPPAKAWPSPGVPVRAKTTRPWEASVGHPFQSQWTTSKIGSLDRTLSRNSSLCAVACGHLLISVISISTWME